MAFISLVREKTHRIRTFKQLTYKLDAYYMFTENDKMLFPTRDSFIERLARTKICLCFLANLTHPEKAGKVSTMTIRYLQAMASKCLLVRIAPEEMKESFDYECVVELDLKKHMNIWKIF